MIQEENQPQAEIQGLVEEEAASITLLGKTSREDILKKHAFLSKMLRVTCEGDVDETEITIDCNASTLGFVVEYLKHHDGVKGTSIVMPLKSNQLKKACADPWDADFIDRVMKNGKQELYDLSCCANYMSIDCLLELTVAAVACMLKGQPLSEVDNILNPSPVAAVFKKQKTK